MTALCEQTSLFFDGELGAEEAAAYREHLATCAACQRSLHDLMQLEALRLELAAERDRRGARAAGRVIPLASRRRRRAVAIASVVAAAAAVAVLAGRGPGPREPLAVMPGLGLTRAIEGRSSYPAADPHRPYDVQRAAAPAAVEHIPLATLARLEERGDLHGLAAAHIFMGSRAQAAMYLERAAASEATESDRALLALLDGQPAAALELLDPLLARAPRHPQALWNSALTLRELGLPLLAAQAFEAVAALGEPGWSDEARARAAALRDAASDDRAAWERVVERCRALVRTGAGVTADDIRAHPGLVRSYLHDAVRAAPSPERVEALRDVAQQLDARAGGTALSDHVERVRKARFDVRAPLARTYAELLAGARLEPAAMRQYIDRLRAAGPDAADILLGAMRHSGDTRGAVAWELVAEHRALAEQSGDPWLALVADEEEAQARMARGDHAGAEPVLVAALAACQAAQLEHRCVRLEYWLGTVYIALHRVSDARRHLLGGRARARRLRDWRAELLFLRQLAESEYRQDDVGTSSVPLARAYLGEYALRDDTCEARHHQHELLAIMLLNQNRRAEARAEMARADELARGGVCAPRPFTLQHAYVRVQLIDAQSDASEIEEMRARLAELRGAGGPSAGDLAFADFLEGRALIASSPAAAEQLLGRAIAAADAQPGADATLRKARSYAYLTLIMSAAARGEHERALALLGDDLGVAAATRCVVGIAADSDVLVLVRGADGALTAHRQPRQRVWPEPEHLLPPAAVGALAGCDMIDVLARAPYQGRSRLLPRAMAWRYRSRRGDPGAAPRAARRLVIADVEAPAALGLPRLRPYPADADAEIVRGAAATPARVLDALPGATEIEFHVHGVIDSGVTDSSHLVLSPGPDGRHALTADDIRGLRLAGAPLVILGACNAAHAARFRHEPASLASAFLHAGARAVVASPAPIQDAGALDVLTALRQRGAAGQPAAAALRDERLQRNDTPAWVDEIIVFE